MICAALVAAGGLAGVLGIPNPRRTGGRGLPRRPVRRGPGARKSIGSDQPGHDSRSRLSLAHDIVKAPGSRRRGHGLRIRPQAVVPRHLARSCEWGCAAGAPERVACSLHDQCRNISRVEFVKTARFRESTVTARRLQRECKAEDREGACRRRRAAGHSRARGAATCDQRRAVQLVDEQGLSREQSRRHRGAELARASVARLIDTTLDERHGKPRQSPTSARPPPGRATSPPPGPVTTAPPRSEFSRRCGARTRGPEVLGRHLRHRGMCAGLRECACMSLDARPGERFVGSVAAATTEGRRRSDGPSGSQSGSGHGDDQAPFG